ncbi:MAG: M1 family metallopeptidase [Polyangiaceae bacterium]
MAPGPRRRAPPLRHALREAALSLLALTILIASARIGSGTFGRVPTPTLAVAPAHAAAPTTPSVEGLGVESFDDVQRVANYELTARLDVDRHVVDGTGVIRLRNTSLRPLTAVFIHLYLNAFEDAGTVFRRKSGAGFRGNATVSEPGNIEVTRMIQRGTGRDIWPRGAHTPGDARDRTDIEVPLAASVAPGDELVLEVAFESKLPTVLLRTGYLGSFHMVAQWFPKLAKLQRDGSFAHFPFERFSEFYADFGDYDVTVDAPSTFTIAASGELVSSEDGEPGRRVSRFKRAAVHDFAFAAWDGFDVRTRELGGVTLRCFYPKEQERTAAIELDAAARGLAFLSERFGPYPYRELNIVHPPEGAEEAGGMEYPTLITTGGPFWHAWLPGRALEQLTLHELAHQWFYGMIATNENAFPFLDEGLTSYAGAEAARALFGPAEVSDLGEVHVAAIERSWQLGAWARGPVASPAGAFQTGYDYGALVYGRTATLLRTLDAVFDGAAMRALGAYARAHRFEHPSPEDLIDAVRDEAGPRASAALRSVLFDRGWVDYEPTSLSTWQTDDGWSGEVIVERRGDVSLPVDVELVDDAGARVRLVWDGLAEHGVVRYRGERPLMSVVLDPDSKILLDEDKLNDARSLAPSSVAPRTLLVATLLTALSFGWVAP